MRDRNDLPPGWKMDGPGEKGAFWWCIPAKATPGKPVIGGCGWTPAQAIKRAWEIIDAGEKAP